MELEDTARDIFKTLQMFKNICLNDLFKDVTLSEYAVLKIIRSLQQEEKSSKVYVSEISQKIETSKPAVSKTLKILEQKGFVKRETDSQNRRKTFVFLTDRGYAVKKESDDAFQSFFYSVYKKIGKDDAEKFNVVAKKIANVMVEELELIQERK